MFKAIAEVKSAQGNVRTGVSAKTGKPWKMADQQCAILIAGADYPIVGNRDIYCPKDQNGIPGDPQWMAVGRYEVEVKVVTGEFGRIEAVIDWRNMKPVQQPDIPARKVA